MRNTRRFTEPSVPLLDWEGELRSTLALMDTAQLADVLAFVWREIESWEADCGLPVGGIRKAVLATPRRLWGRA